ncbi:MAG: hypothetical protein V1826_02420 [bacterium]
MELTKDILLAVAAAGGVMIIALTAPGLLKVLMPLVKKYRRHTLLPSRIRYKFDSLKHRGLIDVSEQGGKTKIQLTQAGRTRVLEYQAGEMEIPKQTPWDGKWRFVIFDIPEKKKLARNVFREKLRALGFVKVQQSVWRHKYPCRTQIEFLTHLYHIHQYVDLLEGSQIL